MDEGKGVRPVCCVCVGCGGGRWATLGWVVAFSGTLRCLPLTLVHIQFEKSSACRELFLVDRAPGPVGSKGLCMRHRIYKPLLDDSIVACTR